MWSYPVLRVLWFKRTKREYWKEFTECWVKAAGLCTARCCFCWNCHLSKFINLRCIVSGVSWFLVLSFKIAHPEYRDTHLNPQMPFFIHDWISHVRIAVHNWKWSCTGVPCLEQLCCSAVGCTFPSRLGPILFQLRRCLLCKALHHALHVLRVCEISVESNSWKHLAKIFFLEDHVLVLCQMLQ